MYLALFQFIFISAFSFSCLKLTEQEPLIQTPTFSTAETTSQAHSGRLSSLREGTIQIESSHKRESLEIQLITPTQTHHFSTLSALKRAIWHPVSSSTQRSSLPTAEEAALALPFTDFYSIAQRYLMYGDLSIFYYVLTQSPEWRAMGQTNETLTFQLASGQNGQKFLMKAITALEDTVRFSPTHIRQIENIISALELLYSSEHFEFGYVATTGLPVSPTSIIARLMRVSREYISIKLGSILLSKQANLPHIQKEAAPAYYAEVIRTAELVTQTSRESSCIALSQAVRRFITAFPHKTLNIMSVREHFLLSKVSQCYSVDEMQYPLYHMFTYGKASPTEEEERSPLIYIDRTSSDRYTYFLARIFGRHIQLGIEFLRTYHCLLPANKVYEIFEGASHISGTGFYRMLFTFPRMLEISVRYLRETRQASSLTRIIFFDNIIRGRYTQSEREHIYVRMEELEHLSFFINAPARGHSPTHLSTSIFRKLGSSLSAEQKEKYSFHLLKFITNFGLHFTQEQRSIIESYRTSESFSATSRQHFILLYRYMCTPEHSSQMREVLFSY